MDERGFSETMSRGLRLRLLGGFQAEVCGRRIVECDWRLQKARALVKLLALAPRHRLGREELSEHLWPDADPEAGLRNLYYALHVARRALNRRTPGQNWLGLVAGIVELAPGGGLCIDVEHFVSAAASARGSQDPLAYKAALDRYGGELLPDDPYASWAIRPRERLRQLWLDLLFELARLYDRRAEYAAAIDVLDQLVAAEPTHEEAHVLLIRTYAAIGQRYQALREYARLQHALRGELDVEPRPTTQRLIASIRAGDGVGE